MGGKGSGRLNKTNAFLKKNSNPFNTVSAHLATIGNEVLVIPNHSGITRHPEFQKAIKTSGILYVIDPQTTETFPLKYIPDKAIMVEVIAITDTSTVDFNIEKRGKLTPFTSGTDIDSSEMQATTSGLSKTSFTSGGIDKETNLWYVASATGSTPTKLYLAIIFKST